MDGRGASAALCVMSTASTPILAFPDGTSAPLYWPAYTLIRLDLGKVSPRLDRVGLAVNATNLFDRKYLTRCFAHYAWCWYGQRRTVQGTISYRR